MTETRVTDAGPAPARFGVRAWARWLWRQLTSMRVALLLLFLLAVASIPGSLFPQRGADPLRVDRYIATHPGIAGFLDAVGAFDVYASPWFAAVYLLLCVSLAGCIVPRTIDHVRALRRPPPPAPARLGRLQGVRQAETASGVEAVLGRAEAELRKSRWRVRTGDDWVAAEKGYLRESGNLLFHVCLLVLLAAVAVGSLFGWRATVIVVEGRGFTNTLTQYDTFSSGALVDPSGLAPFGLVLNDFAARFQIGGQQSGAPRDYSADVALRPEPGAAPSDVRIGVNSPLKVGGANVYLQGHGYAPRIVVRNAAGAVLYDDAAVFLPRDGVFTSTGVVKVPDATPQLGFQGVLLPTLGADAAGEPVSLFPAPGDPVLFLTAWEGDLGLDSGVPQSVFRLNTEAMAQVGQSALRIGDTWTLPDGLGTVEFVGLPEYASFSVARDPGKGLALAAAILAIAGLTLSLFIPRRRVWVRARPDEQGRTLVTVAALSRSEGAAVDELTAGLMAEVVPASEVLE